MIGSFIGKASDERVWDGGVGGGEATSEAYETGLLCVTERDELSVLRVNGALY